ncbi:MAG: hypothetical protein HFH67_00645 [Lachnospiraceae bacterium]|nr:hypothetical protein [Lachnospiraceae bacterium]
MLYVDWYYEKNGKKRVYEEKRDNYKYWEDLVTQTHYCISNNDFERIYETGKMEIKKYLEVDNLEAIEEFFYSSNGAGEAVLFPDLPFFTGNTLKCARMRDYLCFRTACLYAMNYELIKNSGDIEDKKRKIRIQGFTAGIVDSENKSTELEQIKQVMYGLKNKENMLISKKADFVKGGLIKIKQYYLETNKIPEIRGASLLLDAVNGKGMENLICGEHIRECLIYAGGGKMMGIFPEGCGNDICKKIQLLAEKETVTAQVNFCSCVYNLERLVNDYKNINNEMDLLLEERQGLRWDFRIEPVVQWNDLKNRLLNTGFKIFKDNDSEMCTSCRMRYAVAKSLYNNQNDKFCISCLNKKLSGGRDARRSKIYKYKEYVQMKYGEKISDDGKLYNKLEDIANNGFIGIIYGDANNMSRQINNLESFMMMRYFSQKTSDAVKDIVFDALFKHLGKEPCFEIIAVGGDDIFLIVPGNKAYDVACTIGKLFDQRFKNKSSGDNGVTMSVGACITHDKMPVQYSFGIAQELLKNAKQKAWEESQNGNITGTVDWMVIENEVAGSSVLEYQRKEEKYKPVKTLRPYTWEQADAMRKFIREIEKEKSFAFQLRQSLYHYTIEESELFYEYQVARNEQTNICNALKAFARKLGGEVVKNNIMYQGKLYSPWLDIIELWDYVEGIG